MGRLDEAAAVLKNAVPVNPDSPQTYNNLGDVLAQMGDVAGAREAFDDAIRAQPDFIVPYTKVANALFRDGNLQQAQYYLERAIAQAIPKDPNLAAAHFGLGQLLEMQGKKADAIVHYRKVTETGDVALSRAAAAAIRRLRQP
jgi:tetratricopeptide (TPR) repeat protein